MCRDCLCLARSLKHKQLRENGDRFQIDRKGPENLATGLEEGVLRVPVVEDEGKDGGWPQEVLEPDGVNGRVMCRSERGGGATWSASRQSLSDRSQLATHRYLIRIR